MYMCVPDIDFASFEVKVVRSVSMIFIVVCVVRSVSMFFIEVYAVRYVSMLFMLFDLF